MFASELDFFQHINWFNEIFVRDKGFLKNISRSQYTRDVSSVQSLSHDHFLWPHGLQDARPPCHHQLPEFTQTHVHWVCDAIQPSHPLLSPSPPALNLSQHWGLFQWVSSSNQVAKGLAFQLQHQSFQWIFRTGWISLQSNGLSRVFSNTTVQKHQFFGTQASL